MPAALGLIDDKIKSLLKIKLYQWKNIARKATCDQNATIIQRFLRKKLGNYFLKKRVNFFSNLSHKSFKYNYSAIAIATCNILLQLFEKKSNTNFVLTTYNFPFIEECSKNICENINEIIYI